MKAPVRLGLAPKVIIFPQKLNGSTHAEKNLGKVRNKAGTRVRLQVRVKKIATAEPMP
jgi:hypothetical protein